MMSMKKPGILLICTLGLTALSACNADEANKTPAAAKPAAAATPTATPAAATTSTKVATVNGVVIPQVRADLLIKERLAQGQPDTPELRNAIREDLISRELLAQEAVKKGFDKNPDAVTQIELAKQSVLVRTYLQDVMKSSPVGDDALKAEYEKIKAQMGDKEYKVRHILVEKEAEAKDIIAQLKKGVKFEKLAAKSKDPSKSNGGDLGWSAPGAYVKPFADAMMALKKGEYTKSPVQSQFGWHVIQLDDMRAMQAPPLDQIKPQLSQRMQQQQIEKTVADLRAKAKVE